MALTISLILTTLETFEQKTFANFKALWLFTNVLVYEIWEV